MRPASALLAVRAPAGAVVGARLARGRTRLPPLVPPNAPVPGARAARAPWVLTLDADDRPEVWLGAAPLDAVARGGPEGATALRQLDAGPPLERLLHPPAGLAGVPLRTRPHPRPERW